MFNEKDWERIKKKFENRKELLKDIVQYFDPNIMEQFKFFFEENILEMDQEISLQVVIDASILNSHIRAYINHKHSFLLDLLESPFFLGVAPNKLKNEIHKHIDDIAKDCKKDSSDILVVAERFLSKITYQEMDKDLAFQKANEMLAERDEDDIEYVALFLKLGKHAVITRDDDILDLEGVKSWRSTKEACEIISIYQQGTVSFVVLATSVPLLGILAFELGALLIGGLLLFLTLLIDKIIKIIKIGYDFISSLPDEWKLILGILFVTSMIWKDSRELIFNAIKKQIKNYILKIKNFIELVKPYLKIAGKWCAEEIVTNGWVLIDNIMITITQMNNLDEQLNLESKKYQMNEK